MQANGGNRTVPTLMFADGTALTNPSIDQVKAQLAAAVGGVSARDPRSPALEGADRPSAGRDRGLEALRPLGPGRSRRPPA